MIMYQITDETAIQLDHSASYLKPVDVLLCILAARLTASDLISQFVNDDVKRPLLFQWLIEIKLK